MMMLSKNIPRSLKAVRLTRSNLLHVHCNSSNGIISSGNVKSGTIRIAENSQRIMKYGSFHCRHHRHHRHYQSATKISVQSLSTALSSSSLMKNQHNSNNNNNANNANNAKVKVGVNNNMNLDLIEQLASNEFYTTMHNVLMRTNTQSDSYDRIMMSSLSSSMEYVDESDYDDNNNDNIICHSNSHNIHQSTNTSSSLLLSSTTTSKPITTAFHNDHHKLHYHNQYHKKSHLMMNSRLFSTSGPSSKSDVGTAAKTDEILKNSSPSSSSTTTASTTASSSSSSDNPTKPPTALKKDPSFQEKSITMMKSMVSSITSFLAKIPGVLWFYLTHPTEFKQKLIELKEAAKKEAHHYYMGSKLLLADIRTARQMLGRLLQGSTLTRRERKQFIRTVTDVFRVVPMSIFVLIPFMEFALPFALKIFPNMLPSTFQDSLKAEENMKKELKSRIAMAEFFQETLQDLVKGQRKNAAKTKENIKASDEPTTELESNAETREETAASFLEFIEKARKGEFLPPEVIIRYSSFFKDELTLDNMPRMQLINMCKYMSIPPYGNDNFLRFQLRHKVRILQEDDQRILWEGIDSLTKMELREACQERGMRSTGLSKDAYKRSLQQWIDLSVNRNVPISLLIMSRTFFLRDEMTSRASLDTDGSKSVAGLADAISGLDREVVNEVILESVTQDDKKKDPELMKLKLEVLEHQNELIKEETEQRLAEEAKKAEMALEKEKQEEAKKAELEREKQELTLVDDIDITKSQQEKDILIHQDENSVESSKIIQNQESVHDAEMKIESTDKAEVAVTKDTAEKEEEGEEKHSLSSEEMDAISQLVSPDPVSAERQKLEKIKAAMLEEDTLKTTEESSDQIEKKKDIDVILVGNTSKEEEEFDTENFAENQDKQAAQQILDLEQKSREESDTTTVISMNMQGEIDVGEEEKKSSQEEEKEEPEPSDKKLNMAIERLKSKVESMVGNIEIQLSDVEEKIGSKLHYLDKDMDGILSREEMALTLQSVLKRPLTFDEAMAITADMDENKDGYFSMEELSKWLETNKLVKLVEEGRDAEVDRLIAEQAAKLNEKRRDMETNQSNDDSQLKT